MGGVFSLISSGSGLLKLKWLLETIGAPRSKGLRGFGPVGNQPRPKGRIVSMSFFCCVSWVWHGTFKDTPARVFGISLALSFGSLLIKQIGGACASPVGPGFISCPFSFWLLPAWGSVVAFEKPHV